MPYGQILQYGTAALSPYVHALGVGATNYCVFLTQDTTGVGVARALPRAFVADVDKAAAAITITDNTAAGPATADAFIVGAHSILDVGPVFNGPTRTANLAGMYNPGSTRTPRAYRSLHRNVSFAVAGNATTDVVITDRLGNANKIAFVSPSSDPADSTLVGQLAKVFVFATAADTTTLRCVRDDAAAFGGGAAAITFDVMIVARVAVANVEVGPMPLGMRLQRATAGANNGLPSDDYSGADVARAQTGAVAAYAAQYQNVDGIVAGGVALVHNLGATANAMALVGYSATPGVGIPIITNNATSVTTMTLARQGGDINNAYVLFARPYSIFQSEAA